MKVHIITIGDEILIGQTIDTNSAWMGQQLNLVGAEIAQISSVPDTLPAIIDALTVATATANVVLLTGGLGPTRDDITKKALVQFFETEFYFSEPAWAHVQRSFNHWGKKPTAAHREQCFMPKNATLLTNKLGTAPGMWFEANQTVYVSMPGVPYEMKYLMEQEVLPRLLEKFPPAPIAHRTLLTAGEGESKIAERLQTFEDNLPEGIKLAYLPGLGQVKLRLTGRHSNHATLQALLDAKKEELRLLVPELVFGYENDTIEHVIGQLLLQRQWTLATAESCTGGLIGHRITSVPGASAYYEGGFVTYSYDSKVNILQVKRSTLEQHGAVSEAVVKEMVQGALHALQTDVGMAISGIMGPGGGTPEKPVGTVWMAVGNQDKIITQLLTSGKDRDKNTKYAANQALNLLRKFLLQLPQ